MHRSDLLERIERHPIEGSIAQQRAAFAALADLQPAPFDGSDTTRSIAGTVTRVLRPRDATPGTLLVYAHGGGYVLGSPDTHLNLARTLAATARCELWLPAVPRAPEHRWRDARDAFAALLDAAAESLERAAPGVGVIASGDSAGGHLALATVLSREAARDAVSALVLFSPNTLRDYTLTTTRHANASSDAMNDHAQDHAFAELAFGHVDPEDPLQTLARAALDGLPGLYLDVGSDEVLLDDTLVFAHEAARAGVDVTLHIDDDAFHLRQLFAGHHAPGDASLQRAGAWIRARRA